MSVNDALRVVLDAHPHLEILPLEVLAHDLETLLRVTREVGALGFSALRDRPALHPHLKSDFALDAVGWCG